MRPAMNKSLILYAEEASKESQRDLFSSRERAAPIDFETLCKDPTAPFLSPFVSSSANVNAKATVTLRMVDVGVTEGPCCRRTNESEDKAERNSCAIEDDLLDLD